MPASTRGRTTFLAAAAVVALVAGCAGSGAAAPTPSPSAQPLPSPSPAAFEIEVSPPEEPVAIRVVIPGANSSFLVKVVDPAPGSGPITISATARGASIGSIVQPTASKPVAEVWFTADATTTETTGTVTITATRGTTTRTATRSVGVMPMPDERGKDAKPYFERWIAWLAKAHPELGITTGTSWQPQFVSTLLVVSHYAYYSAEWELTVAWHNMIPPYDWTEIHLRHRGIDLTPSLAFRQDSVHDATEPHPVAPPEVVVR